jgi:hypothetical protein
MNVKDFTAIIEKLVRSQMPYGYDNTDRLLIGINVDGKTLDIENIRVVPGGIVIDPAGENAKQQVPKLLQPEKKSTKKENT